MRAQVAASGVARVSGAGVIKALPRHRKAQGAVRHIAIGRLNTTGRRRVVFCGAPTIHLSGPQRAAPQPTKAPMSYALATLLLIALSLAAAAVVLTNVQHRLHGLRIALTSDF
jgi:hypothetical protein